VHILDILDTDKIKISGQSGAGASFHCLAMESSPKMASLGSIPVYVNVALPSTIPVSPARKESSTTKHIS
jgi:hypothetical protein